MSDATETTNQAITSGLYAAPANAAMITPSRGSHDIRCTTSGTRNTDSLELRLLPPDVWPLELTKWDEE